LIAQSWSAGLLLHGAGWPGWANFSLMGDCFLWLVFFLMTEGA
jgi:hypothetical protein